MQQAKLKNINGNCKRLSFFLLKEREEKMKKKKLFLFPIMFLVGILFSVFNINVNAAQLNLHYKDGVYFARFGNGGPYTSMAFPFYEIDGKITYCIQPNVEITGYNYQYIDVNTPLPYSNEIKTKVQLIGHYGYEYPGHQTDNYRDTS